MESISDLNRILFDRLEAFDNKNMTEEELNREIQKTEAVVKVSDVILKNASLALRAQQLFNEYGMGQNIDIPLLGINNDRQLRKNKELRQEIDSYGKIK